MEKSNGLAKDLDTFQVAVDKLSETIKNCGADWNDAQYASMSSAISTIAASSKKVKTAGANCISAIKRFQKIESE